MRTRDAVWNRACPRVEMAQSDAVATSRRRQQLRKALGSRHRAQFPRRIPASHRPGLERAPFSSELGLWLDDCCHCPGASGAASEAGGTGGHNEPLGRSVEWCRAGLVAPVLTEASGRGAGQTASVGGPRAPQGLLAPSCPLGESGDLVQPMEYAQRLVRAGPFFGPTTRLSQIGL